MGNVFGIIGLGVMGRSLALNLNEQAFSISVYSREQREVDTFQNYGANHATAYTDLAGFVGSLGEPRTILLMITAGSPVDETIEKLRPLLKTGDIIIDGGNSYFKDTIRRCRTLESSGIHYIGCGISGGEAGARHGASLMPGGAREAWEHARPILEALAAKDDRAALCCRYIGPDGAGHFVKMVHNGIEYADMQLIGEAYTYLKDGLGLSAAEMQQIFATWNQGVLRSYLIGITADILGKTDADTGNPLVEMILDQAGQKGTGKWTAQEALDLGVPAPTLAEAVFARCISAIKGERVHAAQALIGPKHSSMKVDRVEAVRNLEAALYAGKISAYAQGLALIKAASQHYGWSIDLAGVASVWRAGCIIQASLVGKIQEAYAEEGDLGHLFLAPYFQKVLAENQSAWRSVIAGAVQGGLPMAAMNSALAYYDGYRSERLPANLLQAQRDYFGAHTYERTDRDGRYHTEWLSEEKTLKSNPV